ncbi:hypothetical protein GOV03_01765 [Candidatus Woesearchaeota archaeon]|nr:hypothetical protein [Candidatus Woesearchaeota archaeon]
MAEFKLVLSKKDGKSFQKVIKDNEANALLKKSIGDKVSGKDIGMEGYEFEITGGSDKCGFPMRKGILQTRQKITLTKKGVGFSGKDRNKNKRKGLRIKKTVCGERIGNSTVQINLKILKEGKEKLGEVAPAEGEAKPVEEAKEAPKEEKKEEPKEKDKEEKKEVLRSEASGTPEAKPLSEPKKDEAPTKEPAKEEKKEVKE